MQRSRDKSRPHAIVDEYHPANQGDPMTSERDREIKRRRHRRDKVRKLRTRLERTTDVRQRAVVIRKIQRVSPTAPVPES